MLKLKSLSVEDVIKAWLDSKAETRSEASYELQRFVLSSIANNQPVSAHVLAEALNRPVEVIEKVFAKQRKRGADFDNDGNLIGMALTMKPTRYQFNVNGHDLYAWCALDTVFLPGLVGAVAEVKSVCPATGEKINLIISPTGINSSSPESVVVSVVVPGYSTACVPGQQGGAAGAACSSMDFFASREVAKAYFVANPDAALFSLDETWKLANEVWIKPYSEAKAAITL